MAKNKNSYSSVKTVRNLFNGVTLLTAEQQEALVALFATFKANTFGSYEIKIGDATITLNLRGKLGQGEMEDIYESEDATFFGKSEMLLENVYKRELITYLKHRFDGMYQTLSWGLMRNTLERRARHYQSMRSKAQMPEERYALREMAEWLSQSDTCRKMLNLCGKYQVAHSEYTYEYVGGGRYRIAINK